MHACMQVTNDKIVACHVHPLLCTDFHVQAMRLFVGYPVWTPLNRPQEENVSRQRYLERHSSKQVAAA